MSGPMKSPHIAVSVKIAIAMRIGVIIGRISRA